LATTIACAARILPTKALKEALNNALNLYDGHKDVLATIPSTKGILATWAETVALAENLLTHLARTTVQVEKHLHQAADEQAAHESTHRAASGSLRSCTDSLRAVDQSIAEKKGTLVGLRLLPTEILPRIFMEAVDARQREIINSLSSYYDAGEDYYDLNTLPTTLNLVPFALSATCKRWRSICQSTPGLWKYARVPTTTAPYPSKVIGKAQFMQGTLLAQNQPLELTVYPCYQAIYSTNAYSDLVLPPGSQTNRVNLVWYNNFNIPDGIPSPTELYIMASANSQAHYTQTLPHELLTNTKDLGCMGLTPAFTYSAGVQSLHIFLNQSGSLPQFQSLLQNCPRLMELYLEINVIQRMPRSSAFTHQQLHTLYLTGLALPWVIYAFAAGCRLPRLAVLTDINGSSPEPDISQTNQQFSQITRIEIQAVSVPSVVAQFRPLFDVATALRTLTLAGSAVEPLLELLALSVPKRVDELIVRDSDASGMTLRDYLAAVERDGGGTSGMEVAWNNCPNFSSEYGRASGAIHL